MALVPAVSGALVPYVTRGIQAGMIHGGRYLTRHLASAAASRGIYASAGWAARRVAEGYLQRVGRAVAQRGARQSSLREFFRFGPRGDPPLAAAGVRDTGLSSAVPPQRIAADGSLSAAGHKRGMSFGNMPVHNRAPHIRYNRRGRLGGRALRFPNASRFYTRTRKTSFNGILAVPPSVRRWNNRRRV